MKSWNDVLSTDRDRATILIRFIVGYVFIMEGIQKFVYSDKLGVGRFIKIGIPYPDFFAPFVGGCEIIFGSFILITSPGNCSGLYSVLLKVAAIFSSGMSCFREVLTTIFTT